MTTTTARPAPTPAPMSRFTTLKMGRACAAVLKDADPKKLAIVIVKTPVPLNQELLVELRAVLVKAGVAPNTILLALHPDVGLEALSEEDMERLGWVRKERLADATVAAASASREVVTSGERITLTPAPDGPKPIEAKTIPASTETPAPAAEQTKV